MELKMAPKNGANNQKSYYLTGRARPRHASIHESLDAFLDMTHRVEKRTFLVLTSKGTFGYSLANQKSYYRQWAFCLGKGQNIGPYLEILSRVKELDI